MLDIERLHELSRMARDLGIMILSDPKRGFTGDVIKYKIGIYEKVLKARGVDVWG